MTDQAANDPAQPAANTEAATKFLDTLFGAPAPAPFDAPAGTPDAVSALPETAPPPAAEPVKEDVSLAALIRQQREDRQARVAKEREAQTATERAVELEGKLSKLSKTDMIADPIGFAQAHGMTEQEMALIGQAYLYHLVPDRAPPDLRYKLLEAKTSRERKLDEQRRTDEQRNAALQHETQQVQQYQAILRVAAQTWDAGTEFPESKQWFGGNHDEYAESLVHTARNIAESARSRGEVADLSPKAVAAALEGELAPRAQRIRGTGSKPTQPGVTVGTNPAGGVQPAVMSTRGQGASPAPKATTEAERIERAMAVAFPSR